MAFLDPQSITIGTDPALTLPRQITGTVVGKFTSPDGVVELTLDPRNTAKRRRNVARLYHSKVINDPLVVGISTREGYMVSITIDRPFGLVTDAEVLADLKALITWGSAATDTNFKKLIAGEN